MKRDVLSPMRMEWADQVFTLFDIDESGDLTPQEFLFLMRSQDPDLTEAEVRASMALTGMRDADRMTRDQFFTWVNVVFGQLSDNEFEETMALLLETDEAPTLSPRP